MFRFDIRKDESLERYSRSSGLWQRSTAEAGKCCRRPLAGITLPLQRRWSLSLERVPTATASPQPPLTVHLETETAGGELLAPGLSWWTGSSMAFKASVFPLSYTAGAALCAEHPSRIGRFWVLGRFSVCSVTQPKPDTTTRCSHDTETWHSFLGVHLILTTHELSWHNCHNLA